MPKNKIPEDLAQPLREFVRNSGMIRQTLALAEDSGVQPMMSVQRQIEILDAASAAARAHIDDVENEIGQRPVIHFASTLVVPEGYVVVTKHDRMIWMGRLADMMPAAGNGNWPGGVTAHLSVADYARVMDGINSEGPESA